jgi:transcriptional regulator with XRE-family HTH domain
MSRPTNKAKTPTQQALISLRQQLNLTQQDLAVAMNTTTTSVARWETSLSPRGRALDQLARFAAQQGLTEWEALFRRAILQETFLEFSRRYFLADEGLDLQIAVANVYQFREHPKVARSFDKMMDALVLAHQQVARLVKEDTETLTVEDLISLNGRLGHYRKQQVAQTTTPKKRTKE